MGRYTEMIIRISTKIFKVSACFPQISIQWHGVSKSKIPKVVQNNLIILITSYCSYARPAQSGSIR